ncbi:MAG: hypothetical protein JWQ23_2451, partial [Herminiimonas sp.]|nr:hypothetical protein [Herminiimonas sp.]
AVECRCSDRQNRSRRSLNIYTEKPSEIKTVLARRLLTFASSQRICSNSWLDAYRFGPMGADIPASTFDYGVSKFTPISRSLAIPVLLAPGWRVSLTASHLNSSVKLRRCWIYGTCDTYNSEIIPIKSVSDIGGSPWDSRGRYRNWLE